MLALKLDRALPAVQLLPLLLEREGRRLERGQARAAAVDPLLEASSVSAHFIMVTSAESSSDGAKLAAADLA